MNDFTLICDTNSDMPLEMVKELEIEMLPFSFLMDGKNYLNYSDSRELSPKDFYKALREGKSASTSLVNSYTFYEFFKPYLISGKDVLYIGFSSGLSASFEQSQMAAKQLSEEFPDRKIICIDSLCASMGEALLAYYAALEKKNGKTIEEVADITRQLVPTICHWFTVDDLQHLKRGGRVSAATAAVGTLLSIKPILHVDNAGKLMPKDKIRGRKKSIEELFNIMKENIAKLQEQTVFISHGDCIEDAEYLKELTMTLGVQNIVIGHIGPVIGAHSGPGTVALFFVGKER